MGKPTGFLEFERKDRGYRPVEERVRHFREFVTALGEAETKKQAARCMDCGIPYCHNGCPVNNQIPDWNDLVYRGEWETALSNLHSTNNFPEVTGRVCPAPCEASCTLNIPDTPVTIKSIECAIADRGFDEGWIQPQPPTERTGRKVAVVGSGPAGLAAAQQLARAGHEVHVFEKNAKPGGLLRYGIPDFKMEKHIVDRRIAQMEAEGVVFHCNAAVGKDLTSRQLLDTHDAVLLACGSEEPRELAIPGRELVGIYRAMDYLPQQNRRNGGEPVDRTLGTLETAGGRHVVVIGGGDTGSDCIGTAFRQGAISVTQLEIMPEPPAKENKGLTWPHWPLRMRTSSSQAEGAAREFSVTTKRFEGLNGRVTQLVCARCDEKFQEIEGSEFVLPADLVLLAMGFVHPVAAGPITEFGLALDGRRNVKADDRSYRTSHEKVFVAGDMRRGQSLVVWAIREGRQAAHAIDKALMGASVLPR
ncbi:MAG: glutamate synthase small subunit [Rhizobiales bacterium]|nr:glutamate synthase small subunit [Hyphomicrobiales bacterium]